MCWAASLEAQTCFLRCTGKATDPTQEASGKLAGIPRTQVPRDSAPPTPTGGAISRASALRAEYSPPFIPPSCLGFPGGPVVNKESACNAGHHLQCRRRSFSPWVRRIPWRRKWLPTPVCLSGKFHGQRSLAGYSPWGHKTWTRLSD